MKSSSRSGFTIVELLIVIVVIGILAAITITAYNGVQQRARNTARNALASTWLKTVNSYVTLTGKDLTGASTCLGTGYPDINGDGVGDCYYLDSSVQQPKQATQDLLTGQGLQLPDFPKTTVVSSTGQSYLGIVYTYNNINDGLDGVRQPYVLIYFLEGQNQKCAAGSVKASGNGAGASMYTYGDYYSSSNNMTFCRLTVNYSANI